MQSTIIQSSSPNILVRVIWFLAIGWWLGALVSALAWAFNVTIIGLPLGLWLINRLPAIIILRSQGQYWLVENGALMWRDQPQRPFLIRAMYFVLIGWWFSGIWMGLAYLALVSVVLIPLSFWMYGRVGAVTTLFRS